MLHSKKLGRIFSPNSFMYSSAILEKGGGKEEKGSRHYACVEFNQLSFFVSVRIRV